MPLIDWLSTQVKKYGVPLVVVTICVALLGGWFLLSKVFRPLAKNACILLMDDGQNARQGQAAPVNVEVETVEFGPISKRILTVGHLSANASVVIKSEVNNRITKILFQEGSQVNKGDILIEFANEDAKAEVKQAKGELELREADFKRIEALHQKGVESQRKFDESRAGLKIAEAKLEAANARFDKTQIRAPFSGTIGIVDIQEGSFVQAGQELVKLVDTTPIKVEFRVPEQNVHDVGSGQKVEIRVNSFKKKTFEGKVEAVDSAVEAKSHSLLLRATIPNDHEQLKPGMFADVSLVIGEKNDAIVIDESALERQGEIEFVWIVMNGKTYQKRVLTGTRENGRIEIVAGLQPGDMVVIAGQLRLVNGRHVKITNVLESTNNTEKGSKEEKESQQKDEKTANKATESSDSAKIDDDEDGDD